MNAILSSFDFALVAYFKMKDPLMYFILDETIKIKNRILFCNKPLLKSPVMKSSTQPSSTSTFTNLAKEQLLSCNSSKFVAKT